MNKKMVILLECANPSFRDIMGGEVELVLPDGCVGVSYIFESKKKAFQWSSRGTKAPVVQIAYEKA